MKRYMTGLCLSGALLTLALGGCGGGSDSSSSTDAAAAMVGTTNSDKTVNVATTNSTGMVTYGLLYPSGLISWKPNLNQFVVNSMTGTWSGSWNDGTYTTAYTMTLTEANDGSVTGSFKEETGLGGAITGSRSGSSMTLSEPRHDGTIMTFAGNFSDPTHISGSSLMHFKPSGTTGPYSFSMSK